jgi:anti-sigma factor RsiW
MKRESKAGPVFLVHPLEIYRRVSLSGRITPLLREEDLERYAMGRLPASALLDFELHLLVCERCQDAMAEMNAFVVAMRAACQEVTLEQVAGARPVE